MLVKRHSQSYLGFAFLSLFIQPVLPSYEVPRILPKTSFFLLMMLDRIHSLLLGFMPHTFSAQQIWNSLLIFIAPKYPTVLILKVSCANLVIKSSAIIIRKNIPIIKKVRKLKDLRYLRKLKPCPASSQTLLFPEKLLLTCCFT